MTAYEMNIQAKLMFWAMETKHHIAVAPNITNIFYWECDLLTMTRAYFTHEFEIKRSLADYKAEFRNKVSKHDAIANKRNSYWNHLGGETPAVRIPNYYWFVTLDFDIEPPHYAGWIKIVDTGKGLDMWIKKEARRIHNLKLPEKKRESLYRVVSYRLKAIYVRKYLYEREGK